jgi:hypothetical protein
MAELSIWLPTYKRPHKLAEVAKNIEEATKNSFRLYFGVEPEDEASIEAAHKTGHQVVINQYEGGYSNTIQTMYENSSEPFWFHANDDFLFLPNWDEQPIAMFETPHIMVVGVRQRPDNDNKSAICFGRRSYIEEQSGVIDIPDRVFYTYNHNYIDTEFTQTAQARGVWAGCDAPCIDHQHHGFTRKEKDETYKKNDATASLDEATFESRKHLWQNLNK